MVSEEPSSMVAAWWQHGNSDVDSGVGPRAPQPHLLEGTIAISAQFDGIREGGDLGRLFVSEAPPQTPGCIFPSSAQTRAAHEPALLPKTGCLRKERPSRNLESSTV